MESEMKDLREKFYFRELHPRLFIGTTSDRYAGWIGQIYAKDKYEGRIIRRSNTVGGNVFTEEVLPVDSVAEYYDHFSVLEIDFTFYRPLADRKGKPTQSLHVLRTYQKHLTANDRVILKVPQTVFAKSLRRGKTHVENPDYLNPELYTRGFYDPAISLLETSLSGMIFEQEYQRKSESSTPENLASELDEFFSSIPKDDRYHVEIRTSRLLAKPLFDVLKKHGVGLVLSHWTWLPSLSDQFKKAQGAHFSSGNSLLIRLLTPRGQAYVETYAAAFPFNAMVEGMLHPSSVQDTVTVVRAALKDGRRVYLLINNRAGGNAPLIANEIVEHLDLCEA
jgi:uncharacterized protein YecE (DUF72 family)